MTMNDFLYGFSFLLVALLLLQVVHAYVPTADSYVDEWEYRIEPGDTLWMLARTFYPMSDPRKIVWTIRMMNPELNPGTLPVGRRIRMPDFEEGRG